MKKKKSTMRQRYSELEEISKLDIPNVHGLPMQATAHLSKATEEFGELAKELNKLNGRKNHKEEFPKVMGNLIDELADTIQCLFTIGIRLEVPYDVLVEAIKRKNKAYLKSIKK